MQHHSAFLSQFFSCFVYRTALIIFFFFDWNLCHNSNWRQRSLLHLLHDSTSSRICVTRSSKSSASWCYVGFEFLRFACLFLDTSCRLHLSIAPRCHLPIQKKKRNSSRPGCLKKKETTKKFFWLKKKFTRKKKIKKKKLREKHNSGMFTAVIFRVLLKTKQQSSGFLMF